MYRLIYLHCYLRHQNIYNLCVESNRLEHQANNNNITSVSNAVHLINNRNIIETCDSYTMLHIVTSM